MPTADSEQLNALDNYNMFAVRNQGEHLAVVMYAIATLRDVTGWFSFREGTPPQITLIDSIMNRNQISATSAPYSNKTRVSAELLHLGYLFQMIKIYNPPNFGDVDNAALRFSENYGSGRNK